MANNGTITQGSNIEVSGFMKLHPEPGEAYTGNPELARIRILTKDDNGWNWHTVAQGTANGWEWTKLQGQWTAAWQGQLIAMHVVINGPSATNAFLFDDVEVIVK